MSPNPVPPSESEKRLYAAMLQAMVMDLYTPYAIVNLPGGEHDYGPRQTEQGRKGFVREDFFQGDFERAFGLLADFGVVDPVTRDGAPAGRSDGTGHWALAVDIDAVGSHVLDHFPGRLPTLDEMLTGFIGMATHGFLSTSRRPFVPKREYLPVLQFLAEHGYVGRTGNQFRWTDKAAPAMQAGYHWDENNQSSSDLHEHHLDEIWRSMPLQLKKEIFFDGETDVFGFAAAYSGWLDDGRWLRRDPKAEELADGHGGGFGIAQELEERFVLPHKG